MKTADRFNTRVGELVDVYQGAVPLARLLLEAVRIGQTTDTTWHPDLGLYTDGFGDTFLEVTFEDGSEVILAVGEEMT